MTYKINKVTGKLDRVLGITVPASSQWIVENVSSDKEFDADSTTVDELANVLGTLITDLTNAGILGGSTVPPATGSPIGILGYTYS